MNSSICHIYHIFMQHHLGDLPKGTFTPTEGLIAVAKYVH